MESDLCGECRVCYLVCAVCGECPCVKSAVCGE